MLESQKAFAAKKPEAFAKMARFDEQLAAGKSIAIIQYQYSYACNFHCSHCSIAGFRQERRERRLNLRTTSSVFRQAHDYGLAQVGISGGEPLIFRDLEDLIDCIGPERFHIQLDTNGWYLDKQKAHDLAGRGVDKVQISIDGLDAAQHDRFRRKPGSHARAAAAIGHVLEAGMAAQVATVVDHARAQSDELEQFLAYFSSLGAAVTVVYAKPVGEWIGRYDLLCSAEDIAHVKALLSKYGGYDHTTPQHGRDLGCIAVKRMISITSYGDVLPCPWMYFSIGNVFDTPLAEILAKGMRYLGGHYNPLCRLSEDREFNEKYVKQLAGRDDLPVPIEEVMGDERK